MQWYNCKMALILASFFLSFYLYFQSISIYGGDAGDLVSAAFVGGVAHPPGFPLYTFIASVLIKLPVLTVAWRVSLLSSIPAASALTLVYLIVSKLTNSRLSALIASLTLGSTYIFWLYAIVPEVFMLNLLFMSALIYILLLWRDTHQARLLYLFSLILGLSLAHHHLIITCLPAFAYLIYTERGPLKKSIVKKELSFVLKNVLLLSAGLIPYFYVYLAAVKNPLINWADPSNLSNFWRLVTRADYGTFQSGAIIGGSIASRFLQLPTYFSFMLDDFMIIGVLLAILGVYALSRSKPSSTLVIFFMLLFLFTGPIYFFYAAYIITDSFALAIFERFLLPSYLIVAIFIGCGTSLIIRMVANRLKEFRVNIGLILLTLPMILFISNYPKLSILKHDSTAEQHAKNILDTVDKNGILILERDNNLFDTQYLHYTNNYRSDIILIHSQKLVSKQLNEIFNKYYSKVFIPSSSGTKYVDDFLKKNYEHYPIFSESVIPMATTDYYWLPNGLLYRLYQKADLPDPQKVKNKNDILWQSYYDPLDGSLKEYRNLMLSGILNFYAISRLETGIFFLETNDSEKALSYFKSALKYDSENPRVYLYIGKTEIELKQCDKAKTSLSIGLKLKSDLSDYHNAFIDLYEVCFDDEIKANIWKKKQLELEKAQETSLKEL